MGYDITIRKRRRREDGYFRATTADMQHLLQAMAAARVLDGAEPPAGFRRNFRSRDRKLVPGYKFVFNQGMIVTPPECRLVHGALERWMGTPEARAFDKKIRAFVGQWAEFNRVASERGGYEVW